MRQKRNGSPFGLLAAQVGKNINQINPVEDEGSAALDVTRLAGAETLNSNMHLGDLSMVSEERLSKIKPSDESTIQKATKKNGTS